MKRWCVRELPTDERGQAMLEGIVATMVLIFLLLITFFFLSWGTSFQEANMGSRVLAFGAGNEQFAWPRNPGAASTRSSSVNPLGGERAPGQDPAKPWSNAGTNFLSSTSLLIPMLIDLLNGTQEGRISDLIRGKFLVGMTGFVTRDIGLSAEYRVASNPWKIDPLAANVVFFAAAWGVGFTGKSLKLWNQRASGGGHNQKGMNFVKGIVRP